MLESTLRDQCGLDPSQPVLAGVSGGPDSLCLLDILHQSGFRVIVAHFNHQLRPEADLEASSVAERSHALGLSFITDSADVHRYAVEHGLSIEEAARLLRYRFLFASARQSAAQAVAVGHTADDQVETVLMHFLRGAGLSGLKGMEYRLLLPVFDPTIPLVRPLLGLWRSDTENYCRAHALRPHLDASNLDQAYFRNRLRHSLIPELEKYNPNIKQSIWNTAQALQGDHLDLQELWQAAWEKTCIASGPGWLAFDRYALASLSIGLQRNILRQAAETLRPQDRDVGFAALERAVAFIAAPTGKQVDFINGLYLFQEESRLYLAAYAAKIMDLQWPQVQQPLVIETGSIEQPERSLQLGNGWALTCERLERAAGGWQPDPDRWSAWLDADRLPPGVCSVRPRQASDSFSPLGMKEQTIKLKDFFINVKIPRRARSHWPLVCVGDQVAWVAGYRIAHPFRITAQTRHILHLVMQKLPPA